MPTFLSKSGQNSSEQIKYQCVTAEKVNNLIFKKQMETQSLTKQFLIQLAINVLASAIVSYIMIKLLQPKDDGTTTALAKAQGSSTPTGSTATVTTTPTV